MLARSSILTHPTGRDFKTPLLVPSFSSRGFRFFADGRHLVTVGLENVVQLWDLDSRATMASLYGAADEAFVGVALFGAGEHLAAALAEGRIRLWGPA